jgi:mono/diheme cytochrome c family protein
VTLEDEEVRYYQRQFKAKCARCHGRDGTGGGEDATDQAVPPADFTDATYMGTRSDGQLFYQILMGGGKRCAMPAFGPGSAHDWNEDKIWHMVSFVRRFAGAEPPAADR